MKRGKGETDNENTCKHSFFTVPEIGTLFCSVSTCELEICTCMMRSHAVVYLCILTLWEVMVRIIYVHTPQHR